MHRSSVDHETRSNANGSGALRMGARVGFRASVLVLALAIALPLAGCLGKPEIEDRWTRVDVESASVTPQQQLVAGSTVPLTMRATVTYRTILTGFAVAELRASSVTSGQVTVAPDAPREPMARDIDRILQSSVSLGRATRAITGWDHLIQPIDFAFDGHVPPSDSAGLFLLCYLGEGEEVEREDGSDTLIVTPFDSMQFEILPVGIELGVRP